MRSAMNTNVLSILIKPCSFFEVNSVTCWLVARLWSDLLLTCLENLDPGWFNDLRIDPSNLWFEPWSEYGIMIPLMLNTRVSEAFNIHQVKVSATSSSSALFIAGAISKVYSEKGKYGLKIGAKGLAFTKCTFCVPPQFESKFTWRLGNMMLKAFP